MYSIKESEEWLTNLQQKLDDSGKKISFIIPESDSHQFRLGRIPITESIESIVLAALKMCKTKAHTKSGSRKQELGGTRSLEDMYMLAKYYFPEVTIFDVVKELQKLKDTRRLVASYCSMHRKMMFSNSQVYGREFDISKYGIY